MNQYLYFKNYNYYEKNTYNYNMRIPRQCSTATGRQKKTFDAMEDAIKWAKKMNVNPKVIYKQVAYKCNYCFVVLLSNCE